MASFLAVISPAKLMDEESRYPRLETTTPVFMDEAAQVAAALKKVSVKKLAEMMDLSPALAAATADRIQRWSLPFTADNAVPAMLLFQGEVYRGLEASAFSKEETAFAQEHLRILSGLYGVLRPMDRIQPYRLMMGTPFSPARGKKDLYAFWGNKLADHLRGELGADGVLVNLASGEYFKAVPQKALGRRVITCDFREKKGDGYSVVSTYAKQARGRMARFMVTEAVAKPEELKAFDVDGYGFHRGLSKEDHWVFTRG